MTAWDEWNVQPCANACTTPDGNVAVATEGRYCSRCHDLAVVALSNAAPLVGHLVSQVAGLRSKPASDGSQRTKGVSAALPFNARAFDDANTVYRQLVGWAQVLAPLLREQPPATAAGAWRNGERHVVGLPNGIGVLEARGALERLVRWHRDRLTRILWLPEGVERYLADLARIQRINLRWPMEDKPSVSRVAACPGDSGQLLIVPPREYGADRAILCSVCGRHYTEAEHDRIAAYVKALARTRKSASAAEVELRRVDPRKPPTAPVPVLA